MANHVEKPEGIKQEEAALSERHQVSGLGRDLPEFLSDGISGLRRDVLEFIWVHLRNSVAERQNIPKHFVAATKCPSDAVSCDTGSFHTSRQTTAAAVVTSHC